MNWRPTVRSTLKALLYLLPAFAVIGVFTVYPLLKSLELSFFTKYDYFKDIVYATGWGNYAAVLHDPDFWLAMRNTLLFVCGVVPLSVALSLLIALMLNANIRFRGLFRTVYFLPYVTSLVAVAVVWQWIYHRDYGILNYFLGWLGVDPISWLNTPQLSIPALVLMSIWKSLGYNIIIFLAGLQTIDKQYEQAASVDGANYGRRLWYIVLPLLSPTTFFVTVVSAISSFKVFDEVYALFGGGGGKAGPSDSALTIVFYVFRKFYAEWDFGTAAAASYLMFIVIALITALQFYIGKKKVHY